MSIELRVVSAAHSGAVLKGLLEEAIPGAEGIALEVREAATRVRGVDASILVAVVGSTGTALGALIAGVFNLAGRPRTITIEGRDGRKLQYPADLPAEKVKELLAAIAELDGPTIRF